MIDFTKRLEQVVIEDAFSRRNIRKHIQEAILISSQGKLENIFTNYVSKVTDWVFSPGQYDSEEVDKTLLRNLSMKDLVTELLVAVLPCEKETPIQEVATRLATFINHDDTFKGVAIASEIIGVCSDTKMYKIYGNPLRVQSLFKLQIETKELIDKMHYLNPMVCPPDNWTSNIGGGYITHCDSVLLKAHNNHSKPQALDALNIVQQIEWELDDVMVNYVEKPTTPLETAEQIEAHKLLTDMSVKIYQEIMDAGNSFFFVWKYDFRGRMYSQGYYTNLQATGYKKALLNFKTQEIIK